MEKIQNSRTKLRVSNSKISIRALKENDYESVCRWMSSSYILQNSLVITSPKSLSTNFTTPHYLYRYFNNLLKDPSRVSYAIVFEEQHIGTIGLKNLCPLSLTAECFIEIGEASFRNRGYGGQAMNHLLTEAFMRHNLSSVFLEVLEFNFPAIKMYHRLGFLPEGQSGWHYDEFGQYWRILKMSQHHERFKLLSS